MANSANTTTLPAARRPMPGGFPMLAACGGAALPAFAAGGADAALIVACDEARALGREIDRQGRAADAVMENEAVWRARWAEVDALMPRLSALFDAVAATPACSMAGLKAKAALVRELVPEGREAGLRPRSAPQDRLTRSLVADLLEGGHV